MRFKFINAAGLDNKTKNRLRSTAVGSIDGSIVVAILAAYAIVGTVPAYLPLGLLVALLTIELIILAVIASGASKRFTDPSLTNLHVLAGCIANLVILYVAPQVLHLVIVNMFVTLSFGSLFFTRADFFKAGGLLAVAFGTVLFSVLDQLAVALSTPVEIVLLFVSLGGGMLRFVQVNALVVDLRLRLKEKNQRLEQLATHDALTGLWNRRRFMEFLEDEQNRGERTKRRFAVAILDVDHFKPINDMLGHHAGDRVLVELALLMETTHRASDCVGRYGGEEFTLLLVDSAPEAVRAALDRLRTAIANHDWSHVSAGLQVTVSIGAAAWEPGEEVKETLRRADAALYAAKNAGRNCVRFAPSSTGVAETANG